MGNNVSTKPKLDKAVVVIELAATYSRHTIHASFEKSEETTVQTSEKHPYCSFRLRNDMIGELFENRGPIKLQSGNKLYLSHSYGTGWDFKDLLHAVFVFHQRKAKYYISNTFQKPSHKQDIQWVIILPAGTQSHSEIKEVASTAGIESSECQYVFPSDVLALYNEKKESKNKTNNTSERETTQVSYLYFDEGFCEIGSYEVLQDGTICNNSRNTDQVDGGFIEESLKQLLYCIFTKEFVCWYVGEHTYNYCMFYKDFESQVREFDVATADITLSCKHFVTKAKEYHLMPINCLIQDSKYRDTVRYNGATSSLVFSKNLLQKIMDDFKLSVTQRLKCLLKHQDSLICYLPEELCTSSYYFQQGLEQELQYNNGLLGSLACKEGETVTSDYTIGYVAIENFNKEQHSEQNKTSLCLDSTGEECAIWIFRPLIKKEQRITIHNEFIWTESITFTSEQNKKSIHEAHVMRSKFSNPRSINEEGCELAATIQTHPPDEGWPDEVEFQYTLAVTENGPKIRVIDLKAAQRLTAEFTFKLNIEFLKEPSSVAMQSPILAGLHPHSIKRRTGLHSHSFKIRTSHTYGIETEPVFQEGKHPEHLKYVDSKGVTRCRAVFHKLIKKDQLLHHGQIFSAIITSPGWIKDIPLWRSPLVDPRCIKDPNDQCKVVARIPPPYLYSNSEQFEVLLIVVGDTDIMFKVINRATGRENFTYVDI